MVTTQDYYSQTLIVKCMKLKLKMSMKILATIKICLTLAIIQLSQNNMTINSKKLVIHKMKDETAGVAIEEFAKEAKDIFLFVR